MIKIEHFEFIFFMNVYSSSKSLDLLGRCSIKSKLFFLFIFSCKLYSIQKSFLYCFLRLDLITIKTIYYFTRQYQATKFQFAEIHYLFYQEYWIIFKKLRADFWDRVISIKNQFFPKDFHTRYFTYHHSFLSVYSYLLLLFLMLPVLSFEVYLCIAKDFLFLFYQ